MKPWSESFKCFAEIPANDICWYLLQAFCTFYSFNLIGTFAKRIFILTFILFIFFSKNKIKTWKAFWFRHIKDNYRSHQLIMHEKEEVKLLWTLLCFVELCDFIMFGFFLNVIFQHKIRKWVLLLLLTF